MKSILQSRTFWLAFLQGIIGLIVVFSTAYPNVGILVVLKTLADMYLRLKTTQPVNLSIPQPPADSIS